MGDEDKTTRCEEHFYDQIETTHGNIKKDLVFNLSLTKWLHIVFIPLLTVSLLSVGLILSVVYFSMYAELKVKMETDDAFLKTKQNISEADIHALVDEIKRIEEKVKTPGPVAFLAYRTSSQSLSNGIKVVFDHVWTNVGNGYQSSTGIFTAPRAGLYHFSAVVMSGNGKQLFVRLLHNGKSKSGSWISGDGRKTGMLNTVLNLQKRDEMYIVAGDSETIYSDESVYINFSGYTIT